MNIFKYEEAVELSDRHHQGKLDAEKSQEDKFRNEKIEWINKCIQNAAAKGNYKLYLDGNNNRLTEWLAKLLITAGYITVYECYMERIGTNE